MFLERFEQWEGPEWGSDDRLVSNVSSAVLFWGIFPFTVVFKLPNKDLKIACPAVMLSGRSKNLTMVVAALH